MSEETVPTIDSPALVDELTALERFYFPPDGTRGPRQPGTRFCQVEEETLRILIEMAIAWRLSGDVRKSLEGHHG